MQIWQDVPSPKAFSSIRSASVGELSSLSTKQLRPLLPCLVRMALCSPVDQSFSWTVGRKGIQKILSGLEVVNSIVALLSVDFSLLEQDAIKEQELRRKVGGSAGAASILVESLQSELVQEFERSEPSRRLRLILSELLRIMNKVSLKEEYMPETSELFQCEVFLEEVSDVICIAQAELPSLLPLEQLAETLLRVKYGSWLLCRLVANVPDKFEQVCSALLSNGEVQDDNSLGGMVRTQALRQLCSMNPSYAMVMQAEAIRQCCLPGLAVVLALDFGYDSGIDQGNLTAFLTGLILSSDLKTRNWFAEFVKIGQKSSSSILHSLRSQLLKDTLALVPKRVKKHEVMIQSTHIEETQQDKETMEILQAMQVSTDFEIVEEAKPSEPYPRVETFEPLEMSEDNVIHGSALLKLYCALKNIAGMKFTPEETEAVLALITCRAPATAAGVRFLLVGLCTLLACPQILSSPEHEQRAISLIRWLSKEESHYESASGVHASFGEILLLIAIHFHSNQLYSIVDLVSSLLSIKIKSGPLNRLKHLFTQELFPEKVITSHAITVPVTPGLNGHVTGFLPIHCIHQLLKSRTFTKHYVPVKNWVYRQLCDCTIPLHPLVPSLVDVFVSTVINPTGKAFQERFTEAEILEVFKGTKESQPTLVRRPSIYIGNEQDTKSSLTSRLLMLYYVLLYQDSLLNNMKTIALSIINENPSASILVLMKLSNMEPSNLIDYTDALVTSLPLVTDPSTPRRIQSLCCYLWSRISTIIPRKLWLTTINVLCHDGGPHPYTEEELIRDPLTVLRCNSRVFRCPPVLDIVVRILHGYLAASRTMLSQHLQANPVPKRTQTGNSSTMNMELEREELRLALSAAQESAAIQLLLEICLPNKQDKPEGSMHGCVLREIQCRVCSSLHQMFIADPNIAKLVHFQGYPAELLPVTVAGVPSMHICLAFIPELVNQPHIEKQLFAIQLASHLALKYPLPKAMGVAKYIFSRMSSLLAALPSGKLTSFFIPALPTLVRFCQAFPPLFGDATVFLVQLGKVAASNVKDCRASSVGKYNSLLAQLTHGLEPDEACEDHGFTEHDEHSTEDCSDDIKLCMAVKQTFSELLKKSSLKNYELAS
ncbi:Integrator complex subunit 2 [Exaiptasia diaphana]|nr:Integrator complex subunit 2 [Exaiptasia diaphana]